MKKTQLLLRILAVIGRFGPHLTIVMIFVTQNNFKNGPGISDRLLGLVEAKETVGNSWSVLKVILGLLGFYR